jgi:hypothetical protein
LAICACIFGTFVLSLLIVFLNNSITFNDSERRVYDHVKEQNFNPVELKTEGLKLVSSLLKYHYLRNKKAKDSSLLRLYFLIEMKYSATNFKNKRLAQKKSEVSIEGILTDIQTLMVTGITPFRMSLENYNRARMNMDNTLTHIKDTKEISDKMTRTSLQTWNLLKVLNKGMHLKGLNSITDVYDYQANIVEEIVYYHDLKNTQCEIPQLSISITNELESPSLSVESDNSDIITPVNNVEVHELDEDDCYAVDSDESLNNIN